MKINQLTIFLFFLFSIHYVKAQPIITKSVTQATCNDNNGSVSVAVTGGSTPYTFEWKFMGDNGNVFSTSPTLTNLAPGVYSLKVTDSNNDYSIDTVNISNGIRGYVTTISNAVCPAHNGIVEARISGGTTPYTYSWSNGATTKTVSNLQGGTLMQVEVQDANGCFAHSFRIENTQTAVTTILETIVYETSSIVSNFTATPEECPLTNGSIAVQASGGIAPYTYVWNTTPVKNTASLTGLRTGLYSVSITDAIGCKTKSNIYVNKSARALNATAVKTNDYCSKKQGTANLTIAGGKPPYSVEWQDGSTELSRTGLEYGFYTVAVTDQNNCVFNLQLFIDDISPIHSNIRVTESNCDNISGSVQVNASNGTEPYTYQWNDGSANAFINGLPMGYYTVLVKDAAGCKSTAWAFVPIKIDCYAEISGKVFQDNNGNCIQDAGEFPILHEYISMSAASTTNNLFDYYSRTNYSGQYSMRYALPDQYTIKNNNSVEARSVICPSTEKYNLTISTSGVDYHDKDFAMLPAMLFEDVSLYSNYCNMFTPPRPGFNYSYSIPFKNNGTLPSDGFIEIVYGNLETFVTSFPAADFYDPATKTMRFNYSNLMLGEIRNIVLTFNLPPSTLLGSTYNHLVTAHIGNTDPTPENNSYSYPFVVVGSYDPNDLRVNPENIITEEDEVLTYFIRFQNTGTYPAEFVVVTDVIDQNLDITSITDITASHEYKFSVRKDRTIEFAFENINLADVKRDEPGSHGYVTFKIKKNKNLPLGTEIKNTAYIYFDYNDPIITNTTVNIMGINTGISSNKNTFTGTVYPNPAKDYTTFRFDKTVSNLQLITVTGMEVLNQEINNLASFDIQLNLSKGMYIYKVFDADGNTYSGKLIIE